VRWLRADRRAGVGRFAGGVTSAEIPVKVMLRLAGTKRRQSVVLPPKAVPERRRTSARREVIRLPIEFEL